MVLCGSCVSFKQITPGIRHSLAMKHGFQCRLDYDPREVINPRWLSKGGLRLYQIEKHP